MSTIIFAIADSISHYNASYKIANALKKQGHDIVYIGDSEKRQKEVVSQGFHFEIIYNDFFKAFGKDKRKGISSKFRHFLSRIRDLKRYKRALVDGVEIEAIIGRTKPDLFIIDVFHILHAVAIYKHKIKTVLLQTYVATDKQPWIPPLNCGLIPKRNYWNYVLIELLWFRYFLVRGFLNLWSKLLFQGLDKNSILRSVIEKTKFPPENINYERTFHLGINNIPELILCAKEFDFPRHPKSNQHFVGPMVEFERRDVLYDQRYLDVVLELEIAAMSGGEDPRPIIYCSLGTLNVSWYKNSRYFFTTLIKAFGSRKDYILFMSVGTDISLDNFRDVPDNVYIFQLVPQIDILERASVMITHGGINSINECIFSGVPMVVYPLTRQIDQYGNCARVEYHGLGIRGNIKSENEAGILRKIDLVLHDPSYRQNVRRMQEIYLKYQNTQNITALIESELVA